MELKEPVTPLVAPDIPLPPRVEELVTEDEEPLESRGHRAEINLLIGSLKYHWQGRTDFYAGWNMFIRLRELGLDPESHPAGRSPE